MTVLFPVKKKKGLKIMTGNDYYCYQVQNQMEEIKTKVQLLILFVGIVLAGCKEESRKETATGWLN